MKCIDKNDFDLLLKEDSYWIDRWEYINYVVSIVKEINPDSVLELGAYNHTIVKECDTMDKVDYINPTYMWDATITPYPIDKKYDLFIALQVWEHLYDDEARVIGSKQKEAFAEVMRISKKAILSFPYMWDVPYDCHHGIDEDKIKEWTLGIEPKSIKNIGTRIVYYFDFE